MGIRPMTALEIEAIAPSTPSLVPDDWDLR